MMTATIRAFIAIELPPRVKEEAAQLGAGLGRQLPPGMVRWVQPQHMHLTLRFLGDTAVAQLSAIGQQLELLAGQHQAFSLHLQGWGCFPNRKEPRVIWVGIGGDEALLQALKRDLDERLITLGWPFEKKPFQPHLTIGRVKNGRQPGPNQWDAAIIQPAPAAESAPAAEPFTVSELHLIESRLTPKGPVYSLRQTAVLCV